MNSNAGTQEKMGVPVQEDRDFILAPFSSTEAFKVLADAHPHGCGQISLTQSTNLPADSNAKPLPERPSQTYAETMFYQLSEYPLAQLSRHVKSAITPVEH